MCAFGAVFIRIKNPALADILRKYSYLCSEINAWIKGPEYDFAYEDRYVRVVWIDPRNR